MSAPLLMPINHDFELQNDFDGHQAYGIGSCGGSD